MVILQRATLMIPDRAVLETFVSFRSQSSGDLINGFECTLKRWRYEQTKSAVDDVVDGVRRTRRRRFLNADLAFHPTVFRLADAL